MQPRKVLAVVEPSPLVHADHGDASMLGTNKVKGFASPIPAVDANDYSMSAAWPAVGTTDRSYNDFAKSHTAPVNKVHDAIMSYFAKQFIPMDRGELSQLKCEDLDIIL